MGASLRYSHGAPPLPIWFWLTLAGIAIGLPAIVIVSALLLRARASRLALRPTGQRTGLARAQVSRVTRSGLAGLGVGAVIGVALIGDNRGGLAVLGCAGGYLGGLLVGEYNGQPATGEPVRYARLLARRAADYLPRWAVAAVLVSTALVVGAPIAFAVAPTVSYGNWHPSPGASFTLPGGQTSWPPLFPGTVAAAALALAVLGIGAAGLRRQAGRAMIGAVLGFDLITLAALLIAGSSGLAVPVAAVAPGAYLGNRIMVIAGLSCAVAGLAAWLVLSGWTRHLRRLGPHPDPAPVAPDS